MPPRIILALSLSLTLAAAAYIAAAAWTDASATSHALGLLYPGAWAVVLGLSAANYGLRYLRWHGAVTGLTGVRLSHRQHLPIYLAGFALTATPGKSGEMLRGAYLQRLGVPYTASMAAFLYERLLDLLIVAALALLAIQAFPHYGWLLWIALGLVAGIAAMLWLGARLQVLHRPRLPLPGLRMKLARLFNDAARLLSLRKVGIGSLWGLAAWAAEGFGLYLILDAMQAPVPWLSAVGIYALAMLVGALSFIPGGLGSTEAVMGLGLASLGCPAATALAATLACRAATLWFAVLLGGLACAWLGWSRSRSRSAGSVQQGRPA